MGSDQFRVVWKRAGLIRKTRQYQTRRGAERFAGLFGPEPWLLFGKDPDALNCCSDPMCGCTGCTVREDHKERRALYPPLEYVRIESRPVGEWATPATEQGGLGHE